MYLLEQAEKEKQLFANQAIWEAGEFLKSSLASSDNEKPVDIKTQINSITHLGGKLYIGSYFIYVPTIKLVLIFYIKYFFNRVKFYG